MKRYNIFFKGRLTRGTLTIYSLPRRSSACGVHHLAVDCGANETIANVMAFGRNVVPIGPLKTNSLKASYEHIKGEFGLRIKGSPHSGVTAGNADCSAGVGCSGVETKKEIFLSCSFAVCSSAHTDGTGKENNLHVAPLGISVPNMEPEAEKKGNLSAAGAVVISTARMNADANESVNANPKKELMSTLVLAGNAVTGRLAQLKDLDPEALSSLDLSALNELQFIEEG